MKLWRVSLGERARVDLAYMAQLTGKDEESLKEELRGIIFLNVGSAESQEKTYVTADEYLSDNVREKLAQVRAAHEALLTHGDDSLAVKQVGTTTELGKYSSKYALTELLICGECGTPYRRVTWSREG